MYRKTLTLANDPNYNSGLPFGDPWARILTLKNDPGSANPMGTKILRLADKMPKVWTPETMHQYFTDYGLDKHAPPSNVHPVTRRKAEAKQQGVVPASQTAAPTNIPAPKGVLFTKVQFKQMLPGATKAKIDKYYEPLERLMRSQGISTPLRIAHFISQVGHECADLEQQEEGDDGSEYEGKTSLGNTKKGDGIRFKGRGLIQLTGRYNYTVFQKYLRKNFLKYSTIDITTGDKNPDQVATNPDLCVLSAIYYWIILRPALNSYADADDIEHVTTQINGKKNGFDNRKKRLKNCKKVLGIH